VKRPFKRVHLPAGKESLECRCLRDGSLDVSLITGEVISFALGKRHVMALLRDRDGYLHISLNRERPDRRGKASEERGRDGKLRKRYRERRFVRLNRLVMMKRLAVEAGGRQWREFVKDLPRGVDVNHDDLVRHNNHHENLRMQTEAANRGRRENTPEEQAEIDACTF